MRFGIRRFQQAEAAAHQDNLARGRRCRALGKADAACRQDPLPDGMVHAHDDALASKRAGKGDTAVSAAVPTQALAEEAEKKADAEESCARKSVFKDLF